MKIQCSYSEMVPVAELKPAKNNHNHHPEEQIVLLAKILQYQGIRKPIIVSNQSGRMVTGHGTLEAIKKLGWTEAPVNYQDFESTDQEYSHLIADNSLSSYSELDLKGINLDIPDLGPELDIAMLGLKDFTLDRFEKPTKPAFKCPECGWSKDDGLHNK